MMHGQIAKVVDHFERHNGTGSARPATAGA